MERIHYFAVNDQPKEDSPVSGVSWVSIYDRYPEDGKLVQTLTTTGMLHVGTWDSAAKIWKDDAGRTCPGTVIGWAEFH